MSYFIHVQAYKYDYGLSDMRSKIFLRNSSCWFVFVLCFGGTVSVNDSHPNVTKCKKIRSTLPNGRTGYGTSPYVIEALRNIAHSHHAIPN